MARGCDQNPPLKGQAKPQAKEVTVETLTAHLFWKNQLTVDQIESLLTAIQDALAKGQNIFIGQDGKVERIHDNLHNVARPILTKVIAFMGNPLEPHKLSRDELMQDMKERLDEAMK